MGRPKATVQSAFTAFPITWPVFPSRPEGMSAATTGTPSLARTSMAVAMGSFTAPGKYYHVAFPYLRKGKEPRHMFDRSYPCTCDETRHTRGEVQLNWCSHSAYATIFAGNKFDSHKFGLGRDDRITGTLGKIAGKLSKESPSS